MSALISYVSVLDILFDINVHRLFEANYFYIFSLIAEFKYKNRKSNIYYEQIDADILTSN